MHSLDKLYNSLLQHYCAHLQSFTLPYFKRDCLTRWFLAFDDMPKGKRPIQRQPLLVQYKQQEPIHFYGVSRGRFVYRCSYCSYRVGSDEVITRTYWRTRVRSQCGQPMRTSRASMLTTTTSHGRFRYHPPTWRTEYCTTTTTISAQSYSTFD